MKKMMLIVDDNEINRGLLTSIFEDDFIIQTATDGRTALFQLGLYGVRLSVVLLDLLMPGMDGFTLLEKMREGAETRSIPVIVVSGQDEKEDGLKAIKYGAADYVTKPVDPDLIRIKVESAIAKAENARLRAKNDYSLLQSSKEAKYHTVLESTGTVAMEYDPADGTYQCDPSISKYIAGNFDDRRLWQILMSDMVADIMDVKAMQELIYNALHHSGGSSMTVKLKTPSGAKEWFRMQVFRQPGETGASGKAMLTFNNVNEETLAAETLRFQAERDALTGLYNRSTFFEKASEMIASHEPGYYVMTGFDINKFKVMNDQYGSAKCDEMLKQIAEIFNREFVLGGGISGRISADNFVNIYPADFLKSGRLEQIHKAVSELDGSIPPISYSIGRYLVDDLSLSVSAMYDRAALAKESVKGRYDVHVAWYDESMRDRLIREQEIITEMKPALEAGQFEIWLQPQYNHSTRALIGAEALARWRHPVKGIIPPGEFIPVFERNGFVYELDKCIWRQTCALLRKWMDAGQAPLPVSVNVSRYDLFREDLIETITGLVDHYGIPIDLLRLEITESAFAKSTEQVVRIVRSLIDRGFTVEIDDFGSGYSSLNTLKDVPAQILKLDMRFLESSGASDRGGNVLESVVRMAKWLGMAVIAEGVETIEQADYLRSIGCAYVQGYLYAEPMLVVEYEALTKGTGKETKLLTLETVKNLDNNAFWDPHSMDTLIFNSYVGAATIVEYHNGKVEILRASEKFLQMVGSEGLSTEDALRIDWVQYFSEESLAAFRDIIKRSIKTHDETGFEGVFTGLPGCSRKMYLRMNLRVIASVGKRYLLYCINENITEQREIEEKERKASKQLQVLNDEASEMHAKIESDREMLQTMMDDTPGGFTRLRVRPDGTVTTEYVNENFSRMRGMTREQSLEDSSEDAMRSVHPDDADRVRRTIGAMLANGGTQNVQYRIRHADGSYVPLSAFARVTPGDDGMKYINVYYMDLSEQEKKEMTVRETIPFVLSTVLRASSDIAFAYDKDFRYICCSPSFAKLTGQADESDIIGKTDYELFSKEDADRFRRDDLKLLETNTPALDYVEMIPAADGSFRYYKMSKYILRDNLGEVLGIYGTGRDITEERDAYSRLKLLVDSIPGGIASYISTPEGVRITYFNDGFCNMFGYTREEYEKISAEGITEITYAEDVPLITEQIQALIRDDTPLNCTYRIHTKDGGHIWVNLRGSVAERHGDICLFNAVLYDVSDRMEKKS